MFFKNILYVYLGIGLVFGALLELSWSWSLLVTLFTEFDVWFSISGFIGLVFSIFMNLIIAPILRTIFWLPSVLTLLSPEVHISFTQWVFPGFFDALISQG